MHIIKKFNRFELKYLLPLKKATELKNEILKYALPDPYGNRDGKYTLTSLYYDSPGHKFYWEKMNGLKFRKKLRIRWYETENNLTNDSRVFVEIKQRINRVTQKRRIAISHKEALMFCNEYLTPKHEDEDSSTVDEIYSLLKLNNLRPTAITSYERQAFVGTDYDMGLRITYDTHVTYRTRILNLDAGSYEGFIIPPGMVIMEIKTNERVPYWITELIARNNLQLVRISKYCEGLEKSFLRTF